MLVLNFYTLPNSSFIFELVNIIFCFFKSPISHLYHPFSNYLLDFPVSDAGALNTKIYPWQWFMISKLKSKPKDCLLFFDVLFWLLPTQDANCKYISIIWYLKAMRTLSRSGKVKLLTLSLPLIPSNCSLSYWNWNSNLLLVIYLNVLKPSLKHSFERMNSFIQAQLLLFRYRYILNYFFFLVKYLFINRVYNLDLHTIIR